MIYYINCRDSLFAMKPQTDDWYRPPIPRKELKQFMQRSDTKGLANFAMWFLCLGATGYLAYRALGTGWAIPAFLLYGTIYSSCDARWHECAHGTPFRTHWLNEFFYRLASLMNMREGTYMRWSHTRHHTETIQIGLDPEIQVMRPANLTNVVLDFLWLPGSFAMLKTMTLHALGILTKEARDFVPETEQRPMIWWSRLYMLIYLGMIAWSLVVRSWLPLLYFPLGRMYGGWLHQLLALTQHSGLAEDVRDHRLNTRTIKLNPFFRFLYFNMNYHIEHHMFPMVPFHALPKLHEHVQQDLPRTYNGLLDVYKEMLPALIRQSHDADYFLVRELPDPAGRAPGAKSRPFAELKTP
jgi:fatty acid desaturase